MSLPRKLLYFPIIHSPEELGVAGRQATAGRTPEQARAQAELVGQFWDRLADAVARLDLDFTMVRLYQDGLPICGHEASIVDQLAATGSRNHRLLRTLMNRGAVLMGTESGDLLVEEYELLKQGLLPGIDPEKHRTLAAAILRGRDAFVARRIDETLQPGEAGFLFMGLLHDVEARLAKTDIEVSFPIGKPRISGGPG